MISWFAIGEWMTGYLERLQYPETTLAIKQAATALNAKAEIKGEDALIFTAPYGLLFYIGGRDLRAYCCVCNRKSLYLKDAKRLHFHQYEEPIRSDSWIWFPRMDGDGATNYQIEKAGRHRVWIVNRVRPAVATRSGAMSGQDTISALGAKIAGDFQAYQHKLAKLSPQEPRST